MHIRTVVDIDDPGLRPYRVLREPQLLREHGLFIAESRRVVEALLSRSRFATQSIFVTETARAAMAPILEAYAGALPVYLGTRELMNQVAGFNIHRGCLAAGIRGQIPGVTELLAGLPTPCLIVVTEGVSDPDNMGAIFRNAWAFGCNAVVLAAGSADPLYRKSIRVSLGASLLLPFAQAGDWPAGALGALKQAGFVVIALTPHPPAVPLHPRLEQDLRSPRLALLVGAEGSGLSEASCRLADVQVRIPMANQVDSINAATAAAIALALLASRPNS